MMTRTCQAKVQFLHPFRLPGLDGPQPAGTYRLITDEEELCGLSFTTYRTVLAQLQVPALGRPALSTRMVPIDLDELDACICADRQAAADDVPRMAAPVA
ncbi:hypothetical protein [Sandarakinorhabdus limnophila]|jgi:hypothetical protein|uniref:hypothetical protein n=1 Tax=Sandarakinorhabdus limnophila TaxID=210512 RepID=UPI0026EDF06E|nr:hypothetical protein [Sandarakinorhabdus limnophila]MCM0033299.1 hypothetical protein [Sandarakinorhabdus limnophila]